MDRKTAFYTQERTFWYSTGVQSLFMPIGGWVEPPEGTYGADTPASKRRFLNLLKASSLAERIFHEAVWFNSICSRMWGIPNYPRC